MNHCGHSYIHPLVDTCAEPSIEVSTWANTYMYVLLYTDLHMSIETYKRIHLYINVCTHTQNTQARHTYNRTCSHTSRVSRDVSVADIVVVAVAIVVVAVAFVGSVGLFVRIRSRLDPQRPQRPQSAPRHSGHSGPSGFARRLAADGTASRPHELDPRGPPAFTGSASDSRAAVADSDLRNGAGDPRGPRRSSGHGRSRGPLAAAGADLGPSAGTSGASGVGRPNGGSPGDDSWAGAGAARPRPCDLGAAADGDSSSTSGAPHRGDRGPAASGACCGGAPGEATSNASCAGASRESSGGGAS